MAYKVTISGGIVLEKCVQFISFNVDTSDYNDRRTTPKSSMIITGIIDTDEGTAALYQWALLPATNSDCYKEIVVEYYHSGQLVRNVCFSKAFVVDYSEDYSKNAGVGTFTLYVRQFFGKEIECIGQTVSQDGKIELIEEIEEVLPESKDKFETIPNTLKTTTKDIKTSFTDRLAKQKEIQDNMDISLKNGTSSNNQDGVFSQVEYGSTDLSKMVIEYKKQKNIAGGANVAVFQYEKDGVIMHEISESIPPKHSEQIIHKKLTELGIQPSQVKRIYSEREPCTLRAWNCKKLIQKNYPNAETTYSFEYGDQESRKRGNMEHKKATAKLFQL